MDFILPDIRRGRLLSIIHYSNNGLFSIIIIKMVLFYLFISNFPLFFSIYKSVLKKFVATKWT